MSQSALLVGDVHHGEFQQARRWLDDHTQLTVAEDIGAALSELQNAAPTLIVIAQSRPGLLPGEDLERLHQAAPLARLAVLLGSWCEGETRTGQPLPGVIRVYWHQWNHRAPVELARLLESGLSSWKLPRTATATERVLATPVQPPALNLRVAIWASDHAAFDSLAQATAATGSEAVRITGEASAADCDLLLFDMPDFRPRSVEKLKQHAAEAPCCVAVLGFPRQHEVNAALEAGATCVVSKPHMLGDLWQAMQSARAAISSSTSRTC